MKENYPAGNPTSKPKWYPRRLVIILSAITLASVFSYCMQQYLGVSLETIFDLNDSFLYPFAVILILSLLIGLIIYSRLRDEFLFCFCAGAFLFFGYYFLSFTVNVLLIENPSFLKGFSYCLWWGFLAGVSYLFSLPKK